MINLNELFLNLKSGKINPIYLILGNQNYLINQVKSRFKRIIPEEEISMNFASYDMEDTTIDDVLDDAMSSPFFGERRLIFVNNPSFLTGNSNIPKSSKIIDDLSNYLLNPEKTSTIVFFAPYDKLDNRKKITKILKSNAEFLDITHLSETQVKKYILNMIKSKDYQIDNQNVEYLISRCDGDLSFIMNELPKLLLYCNESKVVKFDDIKEIVTPSLNQNVFDLVEYVMENKVESSINLYRNLVKIGNQPLQINAILIGHVRLLIQTIILSNLGYSQGSIAQKLKVHPYRVKLSLRESKKTNFSFLKKLYMELFNLESELKSSNKDSELLFEMFILKIVK
ncbi:DNA polymerase III subunit delta [Apilactobacillus ozensis DSM 23829 = JCM 17196]|uniref:DNA polymerase III subunit delta n=1 Tax=Apilactobacillus ozensis DSM 23829 = JCM 17196 TaxID=1423781 RepID=A0A0R2APV7_9LACO|nr:DNA polymerase III subunit delta [Apilactobacillus ozensis]KRM68671.1 DNA polymerase III subunit delta [Apilactobacillus ozensis DSM 23829 = JCM 17196]